MPDESDHRRAARLADGCRASRLAPLSLACAALALRTAALPSQSSGTRRRSDVNAAPWKMLKTKR